jgi:hypothetical protein
MTDYPNYGSKEIVENTYISVKSKSQFTFINLIELNKPRFTLNKQ